MNNIILIGRLTNDVEIKELGKGKVANFTLAVSRRFKNEAGEYETDFIDCVVWNQTAETLKEYCKKGYLLGVEGRLQTTLYVDKEEKKRKTTEVVVEKISLLQSKKSEE